MLGCGMIDAGSAPGCIASSAPASRDSRDASCFFIFLIGECLVLKVSRSQVFAAGKLIGVLGICDRDLLRQNEFAVGIGAAATFDLSFEGVLAGLCARDL